MFADSNSLIKQYNSNSCAGNESLYLFNRCLNPARSSEFFSMSSNSNKTSDTDKPEINDSERSIETVYLFNGFRSGLLKCFVRYQLICLTDTSSNHAFLRIHLII